MPHTSDTTSGQASDAPSLPRSVLRAARWDVQDHAAWGSLPLWAFRKGTLSFRHMKGSWVGAALTVVHINMYSSMSAKKSWHLGSGTAHLAQSAASCRWLSAPVICRGASSSLLADRGSVKGQCVAQRVHAMTVAIRHPTEIEPGICAAYQELYTVNFSCCKITEEKWQVARGCSQCQAEA